MGERKVLNKYIPADFDPSLVPRGKKLSSKDGTVPVRMMLPFSIQCSTCQNFLYRGRKFNSKKEPMGGPDGKYLGITRWRFYIKCTYCSRPLSFLTDPKNADYEMENGGTRNYEIHRDQAATEQAAAEELEQTEKEDPMKALESRVLESQNEMADLDNLEEIKAMNARHVKLLGGKDIQEIIAKTKKNNDSNDIQNKEEVVKLTEEDEALVKTIRFGKTPPQTSVSQNKGGGTMILKRLDETDEALAEEQRKQQAAEAFRKRQEQLEAAVSLQKKSSTSISAMPVVKLKRKANHTNITNATADTNSSEYTKKSKVSDSTPILASLLGGYGSSSSSDSD
jgi:hypothetical protein